MTARLPTQLTTTTGAPLPLPAMPQDRLLTVNIEQVPLFNGHPRCLRHPHHTFDLLTDAVLIHHLTESVAAARGIGPVGYIRGHGADMNASRPERGARAK